MARRCTARALWEAEHNQDWGEQAKANFLLALLHSVVFSTADSSRFLLDAHALLTRTGETEADATVAGRIAEALNAFVGGDPETARSALRELEPSTHSSELWPVFAMVEARVLHYLEGPRAALHRLQRTLADRASDPPMSPFMRRVLVSRAADLATCAGELAVARDLLTTELGDNRGALLLASLARLELTLGDVATAVGSLHESLRLPQDRTDNVDFKLLAATVWFSAGDSARAFRTLDEVAPALVVSAPGALTSWVPFAPLRQLAVAARNAGHADIVAHVDAGYGCG